MICDSKYRMILWSWVISLPCWSHVSAPTMSFCRKSIVLWVKILTTKIVYSFINSFVVNKTVFSKLNLLSTFVILFTPSALLLYSWHSERKFRLIEYQLYSVIYISLFILFFHFQLKIFKAICQWTSPFIMTYLYRRGKVLFLQDS